MPITLALVLTAAAAAAAAPDTAPAASAPEQASAIELLDTRWQLLHCGVARGVLYVTYADRGLAVISPAVPNAAIGKACAAAGYPLGSSLPQRAGVALPVASAPAPASERVTAAAPRSRVQPSFTPQAQGSSLSIDARNDGDTTWRCSINFSWTFDDNNHGPRSATTQATLPPRQNNRVAAISGNYRNIRFVGLPSWFCNPAD